MPNIINLSNNINLPSYSEDMRLVSEMLCYLKDIESINKSISVIEEQISSAQSAEIVYNKMEMLPYLPEERLLPVETRRFFNKNELEEITKKKDFVKKLEKYRQLGCPYNESYVVEKKVKKTVDLQTEGFVFSEYVIRRKISPYDKVKEKKNWKSSYVFNGKKINMSKFDKERYLEQTQYEDMVRYARALEEEKRKVEEENNTRQRYNVLIQINNSVIREKNSERQAINSQRREIQEAKKNGTINRLIDNKNSLSRLLISKRNELNDTYLRARLHPEFYDNNSALLCMLGFMYAREAKHLGEAQTLYRTISFRNNIMGKAEEIKNMLNAHNQTFERILKELQNIRFDIGYSLDSVNNHLTNVERLLEERNNAVVVQGPGMK